MKYKFKVGEKVRLYRTDKWCLFDKGSIGKIDSFVDEKYIILVVPRPQLGTSYDCIHISWLAHVKE